MSKAAGSKRKVSGGCTSSDDAVKTVKAAKTTKTAVSGGLQHLSHSVPEERGTVLHKYYPPEMSNERANTYAQGDLRKPIDELINALNETADKMKQTKTGNSVVHWFKADLRTRDNRALGLARDKAHAEGLPLIGLYVISPEDWEAHLTAPVRVDFVLQTLKILKADLARLNIPLWIETAEKRQKVCTVILERMDAWRANHLFTNMEYEVDELRREARLVRQCAAQGKSMSVVHDTCVVPPGRLTSRSSGRPYAVYTPWFRAWKTHLSSNEDLLRPAKEPEKLPEEFTGGVAELFDCPVPDACQSKRLDNEAAERYRMLWPAGEHEAMNRLMTFCNERLHEYGKNRDMPAAEATSTLSPYLAAGAISARTVVRTALDRAGSKSLDGGSDGFRTWVSEVAWRDFYRHVLVEWPYVCMNKPFKLAASNIKWSYSHDNFAAWAEGRTGYPIVDAAMRQLAHQGWMHNRCRMIAASFLAKDLLLDWRLGERYFMEHLIDGDFASNNGGWGFAASVGVDPQPYFRIFNPVRQSERFDPDGTYIRHWVSELRDSGIEGAMIHDPYARGAENMARKARYPEPMVQHKDARERALAEYKKGMSKEASAV